MQFLSQTKPIIYTLVIISVYASILCFTACDSQQEIDDPKSFDSESSAIKLPTAKNYVPRTINFKTPEQLAKKVSHWLIKNNFNDFDLHFMNIQDLVFYTKAVLKYLSKHTKNKKKLKKHHDLVKKQITTFPNHRQKKIEAVKIAFNLARQKVESNKVNWNGITYVGFHLENRRSRYGIDLIDIYLNFKSDSQHFIYKINNCMKTDRGWILTEAVSFEGMSQKKKNKKKEK